ncbi:hypothetical protein [Streptomyces sp. NBC_01264]|uniref:hypothetical protein n=1 Tax=Streptomyces sp. NBC_01264 TaxID=2903804 RepID=UPI002250C834|nr:hypothetical protein [Streptomyces sp. NBC_01264]MCX4778391.1 hypothetical protein [Streptomyces sp. NBC_01264]
MVELRRTIGLVAAAVMAGALPVLVAAPAHATSGDCTNYMHNMRYRVGSQVISACDRGAARGVGSATAQPACQGMLVLAGVKHAGHVQEACYQASRPA